MTGTSQTNIVFLRGSKDACDKAKDILLNGFEDTTGTIVIYREDINCIERKNIAKFYEREFKKLNLNITFPLVNKVQSAWHLYIINYNFKNLKSKNNFFKHLKKNNIIAQFHYIPIYRLSIGKNFKKLPGCEKYYKNSVSLPIFVGLKKRQQLVIINTIKNYLQKIN